MARAYLEDVSASHLTESTIRRMYELVDRAKTDDKFQKLVYGIVNRSMHGQWKNYRREIETIFDWFRNRHDYRRDPYGVELLHDVWATLDRKRFDCDDSSVWLSAAAEVLGAPTRFVTVSTRSDREPSHVYSEAFVDGQWAAMDATVVGSTVGWEPTQITAKKIWTRSDVGLSGYDEKFIEGLGMFHNGNGHRGPGYREAGMAFKTDMFVPDLTPGIPNDVSKTWADPWPGELMHSKRIEPGSDILSVADRTSNERPGGGAYSPHEPIASHPLPSELWSGIDRRYAPRSLNPREAWWGEINDWRPDPTAMIPKPTVSEMDYLNDLAGLGQDIVAGAGTPTLATPSIGQTAAQLASAVLGAVGAGEVPKSLAGQAVSVAVDLWASKAAARGTLPTGITPPPPPPAIPVPAPKPAAPPSAVSKWIIPAAVVGVVLVAGGVMGGRKRR